MNANTTNHDQHINQPALVAEPATCNLQPSTLNLIAPPVSSTRAVAMIEAKPLLPSAPVQNSQTPTLQDSVIEAPSPRRKYRRHGRVASLPKVQRDMINRMLWNGVPYKNISAALRDADFTISERNISNWATGGHLEWRLEQEAVLDNRLNQDHLLDFLRRDDAPELPEVSLQAAATRLSQVMLQKLAHADDPEEHIEDYSKLIDLLCRLNREIATTQKQRDDSRRTLGKDHDPALVKDVDEVNAIETERFYSDPPSDSTLKKPEVPPLLPQIPTATFLAGQTREQEHAERMASAKRGLEMLKAVAKANSKAS